jgi:ABC-type phosphate/phosphonate transport system ATPase subunit
MPAKFTVNETINTLKAIFEKHRNERVCVLATMCVGKTTLLKQIPGCVDMDAEVFSQITEEESAFINQSPWTKEIGDEVDRLVYKYANIKPGCPMFGTVIVDCEAVVYLDISNELLSKHCKKREANYEDALKMKEAIDGDWNSHKEKGGKVFYYVMVTE